MIKFPYGRRDFTEVIIENYLYLDRTRYIRFVEEWGKELLFMRPRRFGKSLWLSTLMNYYDVAKADEFNRLFGHLAIGKEPTPLRNHYIVMRWDFSQVRSHGTIEEIERNLNGHINQWVQAFIYDYQSILPNLPQMVKIDPDDALFTFQSVVTAARHCPYPLYLFIDEYDNFANEVMTGTHGHNQRRYIDLVQGEGMFKTLFKNIKSAGSREGLDRVFITGVSPIVMNDLTNGANVFEDVTWQAELNALCGFSDAEVRGMVEKVAKQCDFSALQVAEILEQMESFYNGSRFVTRVPGKDIEDVPKVYNPTLTFYFLKELQAGCLYPEEMLDGNLEPDGNKLRYASSHSSGRKLLLDAVEGQTAVDLSELRRRFGVAEMLNPDKQTQRLAILLYYLGVLTVAGKTAQGKVLLEIPNLVIRKLYAERLLGMMTKTNSAKLTAARMAAEALFARGEMQPLGQFIEHELMPLYDNRDARDFNELTLKTLFMSVLHYNHIYVMDSEPALRRRYADLLMMIRPGMRNYEVFDLLIEFKHLRLNELTIQENSKKRVPNGEEIQAMDLAQLQSLSAVQEKLSDAKVQLRNYRQALTQKYGDELKLRTYAVVSVAFERIVWEELDDES